MMFAHGVHNAIHGAPLPNNGNHRLAGDVLCQDAPWPINKLTRGTASP
jgi:hypothetical protein